MLAGGKVEKLLLLSRRPFDCDTISLLGVFEPDEDPAIAGGKKTPAAMNPTDELPIAGFDFQLRANRISIAGRLGLALRCCSPGLLKGGPGLRSSTMRWLRASGSAGCLR